MTRDYCNDAGADRLKEMIEAYWAERGHTVAVTLIQGPFTAGMRSKRKDVRSDMVNGWPAAMGRKS